MSKTAFKKIFVLAALVAAGISHAAPETGVKKDMDATQQATPQGNYWNRSKDGWFWYKDPKYKDASEKEKDVLSRLAQIKDIETLRTEVKRLLGVSIMEPTPENVKTYMYAQQFLMDKSSYFADVWRRAVWTTPDLDYSLVRPATSAGVTRFNDERGKSEKGYIEKLAQNGYGLFFFYSSTCAYCHEMAPIVKLFESMYGMPVLAISLDGGPMEGFPNAKSDNGASTRLGVETVPAFYLVSDNGKSVSPVGFGMMSVSDFVDRINVLTNSEPGESF